ncbi:unnamed protein product, partial [Prorocentrum cordatum]
DEFIKKNELTEQLKAINLKRKLARRLLETKKRLRTANRILQSVFYEYFSAASGVGEPYHRPVASDIGNDDKEGEEDREDSGVKLAKMQQLDFYEEECAKTVPEEFNIGDDSIAVGIEKIRKHRKDNHDTRDQTKEFGYGVPIVSGDDFRTEQLVKEAIERFGRDWAEHNLNEHLLKDAALQDAVGA